MSPEKRFSINLSILLAVSACLILCSAFLFAQGADSDQDGMSDVYEIFFGLNPTNSADALIDNDSDGLTNSFEYVKLTDPFAADTDHDEFGDLIDSNAISRAFVRFGDPNFTDGNGYEYAHPDWLLNVYKIDGDWLTNPVCWHVLATESNDVGSLNVDLDRTILTNNLRYRLTFFDHGSASLYMDLFDTNETVVAANLFGNLMSGNETTLTRTLAVPLVTYPTAVGIHLRRGTGESTLYEGLLYVDEDGDGLDREMEAQLGASDYCVDTDGDGLSDGSEVIYGTDPVNADTDDDGIDDGWEVAHNLDPLVNDSDLDPDNDGLTNLQEYQHGTDPHNADTDGDGMPDGWEVAHGLNPLVNDASLDPDNDGLTNLQEYQLGTDPTKEDTDGDGLRDGDEVKYGKSPVTSNVYARVPFIEGFEVSNTVYVGAIHGQHGWEASPTNGAFVQTNIVYEGAQALLLSNNTETNTEARQLFACTNRTIWAGVAQRTDRSSAPTGATCSAATWFFNKDGQLVVYNGLAGTNGAWVALTNHAPYATAQWARVAARLDYDARRWRVYLNGVMLADNLGFGSGAWDRFTVVKVRGQFGYADRMTASLMAPLDVDSDNDGMPDWWEIEHGFNPYDPTDASQDADGDGLTNLQEYQLGTDPTKEDTDGDGLRDGDEVKYGKSPVTSNVYARVPFIEGFEVSNTVYVGAIHGQHGWEASPTNGAFVQTNIVYEGAQALLLSNNTETNTEARQLFACTNRTIWISVAQRTDAATAPSGTIDSAVAWFFNGSGRLVVYDGFSGTNGAWVALTNGPSYTTSQWVRVAAMLDYEARRWQVFLNGSMVATNLGLAPFAGNQFTAMTIEGLYGFADRTMVSLMAPLDVDSDNDGMPDWWEIEHGSNPYDPTDASQDADGDGLTNLQEYQHGTDPWNADTDGDGYSDWIELQAPWQSDPTNPLSYPMTTISGQLTYSGPQTGVCYYVVMATNADGTGIVQQLSGPGGYAFSNLSALTTNWITAWRDSNGDGTNNFSEAQGSNLVALTQPEMTQNIELSDPDSDLDGLPDWWEWEWLGTLAWGADDDPDGDGWTNLQEYQYGTNPGDGTSIPQRVLSGLVSCAGSQTGTIYVALSTNGYGGSVLQLQSMSQPRVYAFTNAPALRTNWIVAWRDSSGNGSKDSWEAQGSNLVYLTVDVTDADITLLNPEMDNDGLPDWWEMKYFGNLDQVAGDDPDNDGLANLQEYQLGTDPTKEDTDGDGLRDGDEVKYGKSPVTSNVYARVPFIEGFEVSNTVYVGAIHGQHGWEASPTNGAFVQTNIVYEGAQALLLSNNTETNTEARQLFACTNRTIWISVAQRTDAATAPSGTIDSAVAWFFNGSGRLVVYDGFSGTNGAWVALTNGPSYTTSQWVRVAAMLDYEARRWQVFLNGSMVATNLGLAPFAGNQFTAMTIEGLYGFADRTMVSLTFPLEVDPDNDGMPDWWEIKYFGNLNQGADGDYDNDGLINIDEYRYGTDPANPDTDGDEYSDMIEVKWGTNPTDASSYPCSMISGEVSYGGPQTGAIYVVATTNGAMSGIKRLQTLSQLGAYACTNLPALRAYWIQAWRDSNGNADNDFWEAQGMTVINPVYLVGDVMNANIVLADPDSDGDGLPDWLEMIYGTDPYDTDTDGDGLSDKWEIDHGFDPLDENDANASIVREAARQKITRHWMLFYGSVPVFTNTPGSQADLIDMRDALNALSGKFYKKN
ncbi:MAG: hypothetical protein PHW60_01785 [Kiritimatiellae bacterium]|nr:hypothetical protein [Kiritimatiellia bacterium]